MSKLIAQLAMHKQTSVNRSMTRRRGLARWLLQAKKHFDDHIIEDGFFGQEINYTTYNLARMNMFLTTSTTTSSTSSTATRSRTPTSPMRSPSIAIVSNPPYSVRWVRAPMTDACINDDRLCASGGRAGPEVQGPTSLLVLPRCTICRAKGPRRVFVFPPAFLRGGARAENP